MSLAHTSLHASCRTGASSRSELLRTRRRATGKPEADPALHEGVKPSRARVCKPLKLPLADDRARDKQGESAAHKRLKTRTSLLRQRKKSLKAASAPFAPAVAQGVHGNMAPKMEHIAGDGSKPWYARGRPQQPARGMRLDETGRPIIKSGLLPQVSAPGVGPAASARTSSLVKLRHERMQQHFLPQNPTKVSHVDMTKAGERTLKLPYTTNYRWSSAVLDHEKLTAKSRDFGTEGTSPQPVDQKEYAPLYSSFSADGIFRDTLAQGAAFLSSTLHAASSAGQSKPRVKRTGPVHGMYTLLASEMTPGSEATHSSGPDVQQQDPRQAGMLALTPETLQLVERRASRDHFLAQAEATASQRRQGSPQSQNGTETMDAPPVQVQQSVSPARVEAPSPRAPSTGSRVRSGPFGTRLQAQ